MKAKNKTLISAIVFVALSSLCTNHLFGTDGTEERLVYSRTAEEIEINPLVPGTKPGGFLDLALRELLNTQNPEKRTRHYHMLRGDYYVVSKGLYYFCASINLLPEGLPPNATLIALSATAAEENIVQENELPKHDTDISAYYAYRDPITDTILTVIKLIGREKKFIEETGPTEAGSLDS